MARGVWAGRLQIRNPRMHFHKPSKSRLIPLCYLCFLLFNFPRPYVLIIAFFRSWAKAGLTSNCIMSN